MNKQWIAVRSKPRAEKVAFEQLLKKSIEAYLPLVKERRKWADRKKWVELPLFSSYLFITYFLASLAQQISLSSYFGPSTFINS